MSLFNSKSEILNPQWIEIVFSGRNKNYGAYILRKENPRSTVKAMLITVAIFTAAVAAPTVINKIKGFIPKAADRAVIIETIKIPPPPKTATPPPPPPPAEPPRPKVTEIRFPPPVVRPDNTITEKDPPTAEELKDTNPGQKDIKGSEKGEIHIDEPAGESDKGKVTEDHSNDIFVSVEKSAEYPGGIEKFYEYLGKTIRYPAVARENNVQGKVILTFVVEKDGSLTAINVVRGIGSGCDEEAIRVVKASKKWKAGMQNGSPVRQQYTVPIAFTLAEN